MSTPLYLKASGLIRGSKLPFRANTLFKETFHLRVDGYT
jgi:hypothetical protein